MYSIDTSGFLDGMRRYYPPATFPGIWARMEDLAEAGHLKLCEMVKGELAKRDDEALRWVEARREMVLPLDDDRQRIVKDLLRTYPRLVDTRKGRSGADPFVIAVAVKFKCPVVTGEPFTGNMVKPRIPDVCQEMGIPYLSFLQLIQREGWVFK